MDIIEIQSLTHRFSNGRFGIENIDLRIREGELVVIAGRNGSGKTTLLRHLNGLLLPESGKVLIDGIPVSENLSRARQLVGMVFQDADSQIVGETVRDDVAFGPENLSLAPEEVERRVEFALQTVGLDRFSDRRPHLLSGGEKRRLAVAGVLPMAPKILVFDEPFSNLDYSGVKQVLSQVIALHRSGHTVLLTTHDLEKVIAHADRLLLMENGRIVRDGRPELLLPEVESFGIRRPCASRLGLEVASWLS